MKSKDENSINKKKKRSVFHKVVNVFIGFFLGFFLLILLILGFTQTSFFRNILRSKVIEIANTSLNGTVNIGRIDGTIFSSLLLSDVSVKMKEDTLLYAKYIEVRTSPLQIFYKKIYARKVAIANANISFLKDTAGVLNISKLFKPTEKDTSKSSFPFKIKVAELSLSNINFSMQQESKKKSAGYYDYLNLDDFRINSLNLSLSAEADIDNNDFELYLNNLAFNSNIKNFDLAKFKGDFLVNTKRLIVGNVELQTQRTNLSFSAKNEGLNIFSNFTSDSINNSKTDVILDLKKFSFEDLSAIVPSLNFLKGELQAELKASGSMKKIDFEKLLVQYRETKLNCSGYIKDLDAGSKMFISAKFKKSLLVESNINNLITGLKLPVYKNMERLIIDTLNFEGEPLNFQTKLRAAVNGGWIRSNIKLDLRPDDMIYDIDLKTSDLNLQPVINIASKFNIDAKIKGSGTSPNTIKAEVKLTADGSVIGNEKMDACRLTANVDNHFLNFNLTSAAQKEKIKMDGTLDFSDAKTSVYNLNSKVENLNLANILMDTTMASDLNFDFAAKGKNFDVDKIVSDISLQLYESSFDGYKVDNTEIKMVLADEKDNERSIKLTSEFGNVTLDGKFSIKQLPSVMLTEVSLLKNEIFGKLNKSFPNLNLGSEDETSQVPNVKTDDFMNRENMYMNFRIDFKDFSVFSRIFNSAQLDVDAKIEGRYESGSDGMKLNINTDVNYLQYWNDKDVLFITGLASRLTLENKFNDFSINDLNAKINLQAERVYTGSDINKINISGSLGKNVFDFSAYAEYETKYKGKIAGSADLSSDSVSIVLDTLKAVYNKLNVNNQEKIKFSVYGKKCSIQSFALKTGSAVLSIAGLLDLEGEQNLKFGLSQLSVKNVLDGIYNGENKNPVDAFVNIAATVTGNTNEPVIDASMKINELSYKEKYFGYVNCTASYKDRNAVFEVNALDTTNKNLVPKFTLKGNLPIDLAFASVKKRLLEDGYMKAQMVFNDFDMASLGNSLPYISDLQGKINANLNFEGTLNKLKRNGFFNITDCSFFVDANYIDYKAGLKISLADDILSVDELFLENKSNVKHKGTLKGSGKAMFNGYSISTAEVRVNGSLAVLSDESKNAIPALYGELLMGTNGDIVFTYNNGKMFLNAPINILRADLVFPPFQTGFRSYNEKFTYKYPVYQDTLKVGKKNTLEKIKEAINQSNIVKTTGEASVGNKLFDYDVDINIKDDARIIFIVNKESNLRLVAELGGNLKYQSYNGVLNTQGELKLLEGSTLEFIKNLDATGSLRFESDVTNPNINIVATYKGEYTPEQSSSAGTNNNSSKNNTEEATIKIKISGTLSNLGKNLVQNKDNVLIYTTAENLKNDNPDQSKGIADAVTFFVIGKFGANTNSNTATGAVSSVAGNQLGAVLNSYLGDYVKSLDIRSVGSNTKINLSGKVGIFKYTFGGSQEVFQDLSTANIKIELPLIENFILRGERKQTVMDNNSTNPTEMINELGLKYRYEF